MQRKLLPRLLEGAFRLLGAGLLGAIGGKDLVEASGHLEIHLSWPSEEVSPQPPDPGARPLFHLLAAAVMAGHLLLQKQILREWSRGAAP
ncbi:MAG: hypothetical protein NZX77_21475, partial [Polyangiaceae bacterium]|nr:hypothetical protein [Polyangiaceae bacterium]